MLGTTSRAEEDTVAKVLQSIAKHAPSVERRKELICGLIDTADFQAALQENGMPSRADRIITAGIASVLTELTEGKLSA